MAECSRRPLRCSRLEPQRRRPRFAAGHRLDVARPVPAVLGPIGGVDPLVELLVIDREEVDVLVDPAGPDVTLMALLDAAVPGAGPPRHERTYRSSPSRITQIVTGWRRVPSARSDVTSSSCA